MKPAYLMKDIATLLQNEDVEQMETLIESYASASKTSLKVRRMHFRLFEFLRDGQLKKYLESFGYKVIYVEPQDDEEGNYFEISWRDAE